MTSGALQIGCPADLSSFPAGMTGYTSTLCFIKRIAVFRLLLNQTSMSNEYLATGFACVDDREDAKPYADCLTLLDSLPYFQEYKQRSYELLALEPGLSVLEVGCGLGDDARRMAEKVAPDGLIIGMDASAKLIGDASRLASSNPLIHWVQADARRLPFAPESFDRCRVDRTLQHIAQPEAAIREMARVLKPGGILLAYDNDWGTFTINAKPENVTQIIEGLWQDSITNRWIGRNLKRLFVDAGLNEVRIEPSVSVMTEFETADQVYNIIQTMDKAVAMGLITPSIAESWLADVKELSHVGIFLCTLTTFTVTGIKPENPEKEWL